MPYFGLLVMLLWVFCLIDAITADEGGIRYLPKIVWILLIVFLPFAGSLAWLVAGRPVGAGIWGGAGGSGYGRASNSAYPEYETRPGRQAAQNPDADISGRQPARHGLDRPVSMVEINMLQDHRLDPVVMPATFGAASLDDHLHNVVGILYAGLQDELGPLSPS